MQHLLVATLLLASCAGPTGGVAPPAPPPDLPVRGKRSEPLIVDWPSTARGQIEARLRRGVVAAHLDEKTLEVLPDCRAATGYDYVKVAPKKDVVVIKTEDDLQASLPVFAVNLKATLKRAGELSVDMTIVGRLESSKLNMGIDDMSGRCQGATHFISGATIGAFEFSAGSSGAVTGGVIVGGTGIGTSAARSKHLLMRDGDRERCADATVGDAPPPACAALIGLELSPLDDAKAVPAVPRLVDRSTDAFDATVPTRGNWSLGWMPLQATQFSPFTRFMQSRWDMPMWTNDADFGPVATWNGPERTIPPEKTDGQTIPPNTLTLHPGGYGDRAVLRWTAPRAASFRVTAVFTGIFSPAGPKQTMTDIILLRSGAPVWNGFINLNGALGATSYVDTLALQAGETLDFVVGWGNNDYTNDSTFTEVTVTEQAAPSDTVRP